MRKTWFATTAISAALALSGGLAQAQTKPAPESIGEIVVTAQKRSEDIQKVPISIQAFSAKQIQNLGVKSSADLGQITPNVDIALPAGPGNQPIIAIRGIGLNDYDTNNAGPNGVYVDEVYLSSPASQTFQTFDLQRVEVLKGPQGTLYGRNTSGGAINFISAKPTDNFTADAHVEYSSFNTINVEGAVGGPLASGLDGRIAFVKNNSDGYVNNALTGTKENGQNNAAFRAMLQWKPSDKLTLLFNVHGGMVDNRPTEYRHIGDLDPATLGNATPTQCSVAATYADQCTDLFGYGTPSKFYDGAYNRRQHLKVNSLGTYLRADYTSGSITYTSITAFEHNDKIHPEDSDASPNQLLEINFGVRSNTFTQEFRASQTGDRFNWVAGAYYLHENLVQNQPIFILLGGDTVFGAPGALDGVAFQAFDNNRQVTDAYAAYGQGEYSITDKLKIVLGGRYTDEQKSFRYVGAVQFQEGGEGNFGPLLPTADSHQSLTDSAFSWRAGLNYNLTSSVLTYVSVATGFKSGDFNGSFLSLEPAEIARQLQPVAPEKVTAYEVGIKGAFLDHRLIVDLAAFYNDYTGMQVFELVPPVLQGGLPVNVLDNAQKAHTDGIDLQVIAKPVTGLTLSAQVGLLETKLDKFLPEKSTVQLDYSGNQLPLSPHTSASFIADYKLPLGENAVDLQFSASYKSHQFFDISNDPYTTQNAYWLENVRVAYQFKDDRWEVAAFVRNLSGQKYFLDAFDLTSPFGLIQGIMGAPETVGIEANYRY
ncbi:MAG TPA: TonB-dependent receptor [Caulobacteraceae bacterium]|jgi:iron complex outermembrane receptor protein